MSADPGRRSGSHRLTWGGLRITRTLMPEIVLYTPSGQERIIEITTKSDMLQLLSTGFEWFRQHEQAEAIRRARAEGKFLAATRGES